MCTVKLKWQDRFPFFTWVSHCATTGRLRVTHLYVSFDLLFVVLKLHTYKKLYRSYVQISGINEGRFDDREEKWLDYYRIC